METGTHRMQNRLLEAVLALESEHSPEVVLQRVIEFAAELTSARYGALAVLRHDGGITEFITTGITEQTREAIGPLPKGLGLLGALIEKPQTLRLDAISRDPRSVGFPPNHPPMESFLGGPISYNGQILGNIYLTNKRDAVRFTTEDEEILSALASQAGAAIENARLIASTRKRQRLLEELREISVAALGEASTDEVLERVAVSAERLVSCDGVSISVPMADGEHLLIAAARGLDAADRKGREIPVEGSLAGKVVGSGRSAVVEDLKRESTAYQPAVEHLGANSAIVAPLSARGQVFGTLTAWNRKDSPPFAEEELGILESLGTQGALVLEYSRMQERLRTIAVLEDRERIARELHDGVIQALFAVGMSLEATTALIGQSEVRSRVSAAVGELDHVIRELRSYIFGLRTELAGASLPEAMAKLSAEFEERTGVVTVVDIDPGVTQTLSGRSEQVVQLAREALSNVGRHAEASTCRVSLFPSGPDIILEIDDDGVGFDLAAKSQGLGLRNMEQRASRIGGELEIQTSPGEGTMLRVRLARNEPNS